MVRRSLAWLWVLATLASGSARAAAPIVITTTADFLRQGNMETGVVVASDAVTREVLTQGFSGWSSGATFSTVRANAPLAVHDGHLYLFGGESQSVTPLGDIQMSSIAADGSLGAWSTLSRVLPSPRFKQGVVVYNGLLYILGGCAQGDTPCTNDRSDNSFASFTDTGALNSWQSTTPFPTGLSAFGALAFQNAIYTFGGYILGTGYTSNILRAPVQADGSLGAWARVGSLPVAMGSEGVVLAGDHVVVTGGYAGAGGFTTTWTAHIQEDTGLLDAWQAGPPLPSTRCQFGAVFSQGSAYVVGGWSGSGPSYNSVLRSTVASDGTMTPWVTDPVLLVGTRDSIYAAASGSTVYTAGGDSASVVFTNTTFVGTLSPTQSPAVLLSGRYSQRVDLDPFPGEMQVTVEGSAASAGAVDFSYRAGRPDGTYGQVIDLGDVTLGEPLALPENPTATLWYSLQLQNASASEPLRDVTEVVFSSVPQPDAGEGAPPLSRRHLQIGWGCAALPGALSPLALLVAALWLRGGGRHSPAGLKTNG